MPCPSNTRILTQAALEPFAETLVGVWGDRCSTGVLARGEDSQGRGAATSVGALQGSGRLFCRWKGDSCRGLEGRGTGIDRWAGASHCTDTGGTRAKRPARNADRFRRSISVGTLYYFFLASPFSTRSRYWAANDLSSGRWLLTMIVTLSRFRLRVFRVVRSLWYSPST